MKVRVTKHVNLRTGVPEVLPNNNPSDLYFLPGDVVEVAETVVGDNYKGIDKWYKLIDGGYIWSGAAEEGDGISGKNTPSNFWLKEFGLNLLQQQLQNELLKIKVSILDTGVDETHPDINGTINLKFNSLNVTKPITDSDGHGTHCTGIIIGTGKKNIIGVAKGAKLNICKVMNSSSGPYTGLTTKGLIRALDKIGDQSDVISISAGIKSYDKELHDKIKMYAEKGVIIIAAIGNITSTDSTAKYPALFEECISVGALDNDLEIADFTVRDSKIDICFPGENIISTLPSNSYGGKSGTSMATPFIAGLAALMKAKNIQSDYKTFRNLLRHHSILKEKDQFQYYSIKNEQIIL